jgi:hypothetical protein
MDGMFSRFQGVVNRSTQHLFTPQASDALRPRSYPRDSARLIRYGRIQRCSGAIIAASVNFVDDLRTLIPSVLISGIQSVGTKGMQQALFLLSMDGLGSFKW